MARRRKKKRVNLAVLLVLLVIVVGAMAWGAHHFRVWSRLEHRLFPKDVAMLETRGDDAVEAEQYEQAIKAYNEAARFSKTTDDRNRLWMKRIRAQLSIASQSDKSTAPVRAKAYRQALSSLRSLTRSAPKFVEAQELLCDLYWQEVVRVDKAGAWQEFIKESTKLVGIAPKSAQGYFRRGYARARLITDPASPNVAGVLEDYRKALELDGAVAGYRLELCRFLQSIGRSDEAQKEFERGIQENPDSVELIVGYAVFLRKNNDSDGALKWLNEAIKRAPDKSLGYVALAAFYRTDNRHDEALGVLDKAIKADDTDYRVYAEKAAIHGLRREVDLVASTLREGLQAIQRRLSSQTKPADMEGKARRRAQEARLRNAQEQLYSLLGLSLLDTLKTGKQDSKKVLQEVGECLAQMQKASPESADTARLAGLYAAASGKPDEAVTFLEKANEAYQRDRKFDSKTAGMLVDLYLRSGKRGKAERIIDTILRTRENPSAWVLKAVLQMEYQQFDKAAESLRRAQGLDPNNAEAANLLLAISAGRDGQGVDPRLQPTAWAVKVILNRANELRRNDKADEAQTLLEQLHAKAPDNRDVTVRLFELYLSVGKKDKALALLNQAIRDDPDHAAAYRKLSGLIDSTPEERYTREQQEIDAKLAAPFQRASAKANLARATGKRDDYLKYLLEANAFNPDSPGVAWQLFDLRLASGQLDEAERLAKKLGELDVDKCKGLFFSAQLARARGNMPLAIDRLEEVLKLRMDLKEAHLLLGQCYLQEKQLDKAEESFKTACQIDPAYGMAYRGLAMTAELRGNAEEHWRYIEDARKLLPNDTYIQSRYWLMREQKSQGKDLADIIKGRKLLRQRDPGNTENNQRLAALYERAGDLEAAEEVYTSIFKDKQLSARARAGILGGFRARQRRFNDVDAIYKLLLTSDLPPAELARAYIDYGKLLLVHSVPLAEAAFQKAVEIDPKLAQGYLVLGQLKARQGKWSDAVSMLRKYATLEPDDRGGHYTLISYLVEDKQFDEALTLSEQLVRQDRKDARSWTVLGLVQLNRGDFQEAEKALTQAIDTNPTFADPYRHRATLYEIRGEFTRARQDLSRAASLSSDPMVTVQLGQLYLRTGELESARREFQSVLKQAPSHRAAISGLLEVYFRKEAWSDYDALVLEQLKQTPSDLGYRLAFARGLQARKDYARAAEVLAQALEQAPNNGQILQGYLSALLQGRQYPKVVEVSRKYASHAVLGPPAAAAAAQALTAMGQGPQSEELFKTALGRVGINTVPTLLAYIREAYGRGAAAKLTAWRESAPKGWQLRVALGDLYTQAKQTPQAVDMYTEALKLASGRPLQAAIWTRIGAAYYDGKRVTQAEEAYLEALKLQADDLQALNNLAYLYGTELRQPDKAREYGEKAYRLAPNVPDVLDTYGWILAGQKDYEKAEQLLNRAVRLGSARSPFVYHLGWVYEQTKRIEQAVAQYKQVLLLATSDADAEYRLLAEQGLKRLDKK